MSHSSKFIEHRLPTLEEVQNIRITQDAEEHKTCQEKTGNKLWSHIIEDITHKFDWCVRKVLQFPCAVELQHKTFKGPNNL